MTESRLSHYPEPLIDHPLLGAEHLVSDSTVGQTQAGRWDPLVDELQSLRRASGDPSYAEIARRIATRRAASGADEHAARVARSTVHHAFAHGRTRIDVSLVREIVGALEADPALVDVWLSPPAAVVEHPAPHRRLIWAVMLGCVAVNLVGREFVDFFQLPFYLDMVGTAIAAIALGPWRGAAVGLATNVLGVVGSGWISLPFALVNVVGALVWGYGVHRFGMGKSLPRFFALSVTTALACSVTAVPIIVAFLGHELRIGHDAITQVVGESVDTFVVAVSFANLLTSTGDKLVSGFIALVVISALPLAWRSRTPLVFVQSGQ